MGMPGVQETFARTLGLDFTTLIHLLPENHSSDFHVGIDMAAGKDLPERMDIFANIGHIYLTVAGGPGVAKEARQAFDRGAAVLPMLSTPGASSGEFGFPPGALIQPMWVSDDSWSLLREVDKPEETAMAVVS